uniref:MATA-HMG n=1 Tax=Rhizophagus irregularis TaxID=588596 RepID=A0A1B1EUG4_9GLOM|nr:MATA-HMG [Rhizophagus irregularis]
MLKNNNNTSQINNNTSAPHFEYVSYDRVQDLYEQRKGHFYFIPEGFEPVLVPNDSKAQAVTNLLETSKPVSTAPNVSRMLPDTDVRLPSYALPCGVAGPAKKDVAPNGKIPKVKKPPRPPNAFILYRRAKQPTIVAQHQGITNNEVYKEIGKMWHEEPMEVRLKFQKMAEAAKEEHMKKYPEYRYRPRRPQERKRRVQTREASNRRSSAPTLPHRVSSSSVVENPDYISSRRVSSISSDGENRSPIQNQQQIYYANSEAPSDSTYGGMIDNQTMPPQFTSYMQPSINDFSVFEAQPQDMSEDGVDFDYDYNDYNPQMINYAGHYPHHQYVQKY